MKSNYRKPVNLGNPNEQTVYYVADYIKSIIGSKSKIINLPPLIDDPRRRNPNIDKAKNFINWVPKVNIIFFQIIRCPLKKELNKRFYILIMKLRC
ncbi:hypothetical protein MXB_793 [Myxobolus squamalis]|nr:hypothetical protein MXB_793 [Myxobolus squamalis]